MVQKTTSSPTLQSPGAGLPLFELTWLRMMFRLACGLISRNLGLRWFKLEAERIKALADNIPTEQGTVPILIHRVVGIEDSSRYWSAFMVLDHLRIVDEGITQIVATLTGEHLFQQEIRIQDVKPRLESGPETINQFCHAVTNYESTINRFRTLGHTLRHAHPWFGPMTAHDWHCLAAIHHWVHRRQLERIIRRLDLECAPNRDARKPV